MNEIIEPIDSILPVKLAQLIWPFYISLKYKGLRFEPRPDALKKLRSLRGQRAVICPNHSSELDADVMFALSRAINEPFFFLTAHEIFHGHKNWNLLPLKMLGCYPVTRGTPDIEAYRTTQKLLMEGRRKLVVFPEGEISHQNNHIKSLQRGAAKIALSVVEKLQQLGKPEPVYLVPIAIKYAYGTDIRPRLERSLKSIEEKLALPVARNLPINDRILRCFAKFGALEAAEHQLEWSDDTHLNESIPKLRRGVLDNLAQKLDCAARLSAQTSELAQAHLLKSVICNQLFHMPTDENHSNLRIDLREVKQVIDLIALDFDCLKKSITQEEAAEFILVLEREIFAHDRVFGPLHVLLEIGDVINLQEYTAELPNSRQRILDTIDSVLQSQLQKMVDSLEAQRKKIIAA
jgi:1-acyl-sn-glycerol-3-phosphate acyltransferase